MKNTDIEQWKEQVVQMLEALRDSPAFIQTHQLLKGIKDQRWMVVFVVIIGVLFSYSFISNLYDLYISPESLPENLDASVGNMDQNIENVKEEGKAALLSGGSKFLLLIILEVVIFYFVTITASILTNKELKPTFSTFIKAEWRMIRVVLVNFMKAAILHLIISIVLGILGFGFLTKIIMFFIYAYYIGYAFFDNYVELYGLNTKQSRPIIYDHRGAATAIGVIVSIVLFIPVLGPVVAPIVAGVATAIYCYRNAIHKVVA